MSGNEDVRRREFLSASAVLLATGSPLIAATRTASKPRSAVPSNPAVNRKTTFDIKQATSASFQRYVGQSFQHGRGRSSLFLESVSVVSDPTGKGKRPRGIRQECFSLVFSAPPNIVLSAGVYTLVNDNVAPFSVYLSRVAIPKQVTSALPQRRGLVSVAGRYVTDVVTEAVSSPKCYYEAAFS